MICFTKMKHQNFLRFKFTNVRVRSVTGNVNQFCVTVHTSAVFTGEVSGFPERPVGVTCLCQVLTYNATHIPFRWWREIHTDDIQWLYMIRIKADSHIACRAYAASMPFPYRSPAMPCVNSHMPCRAPALLRECRVLRESPCGSWKHPTC